MVVEAKGRCRYRVPAECRQAERQKRQLRCDSSVRVWQCPCSRTVGVLAPLFGREEAARSSSGCRPTLFLYAASQSSADAASSLLLLSPRFCPKSLQKAAQDKSEAACPRVFRRLALLIFRRRQGIDSRRIFCPSASP